MMSHIYINKLFFENQHGFRYKKSCQTQLFELVSDLHSSMHALQYTDAIFIDFAKAFDRVPHKRLLSKIRKLQLNDQITTWIENFLSNRYQRVIINEFSSSTTRVLSGVPQGSVLGPLLFLVYINDIAANIGSTIRLFADDCVVYRQITSHDDVHALQADLIKLTEWCHRWQMEINVEKTKHISFSTLANTPRNSYTIDNLQIEQVDCFKYLGVFFTSDLAWDTHVEYITKKAFKKLGLLKRRLSLANAETKKHAYTSLIRTSLEYASIIWHPNSSTLNKRLESVQNKAARFILSSYSSFNSVSLLKRKLNLLNLDTRRKFLRLSFFHSLYFGDSSFAATHILPAHHISTRVDHIHKVSPIFARTVKYQTSPLLLSITEWNALPECIVAIREPASFQKALFAYLE